MYLSTRSKALHSFFFFGIPLHEQGAKEPKIGGDVRIFTYLFSDRFASFFDSTRCSFFQQFDLSHLHSFPLPSHYSFVFFYHFCLKIGLICFTLDRSTSLAQLHVYLFALSAVLLACLNLLNQELA